MTTCSSTGGSSCPHYPSTPTRSSSPPRARPKQKPQTPASVTIIDKQRIERLGEPLVPALLRLTPSAAVDDLGPGGSLTEVRIRGAEANHTLLFVDGIKIDDPASGDAPRFELLNADLASRIEVVRGPQSALWGSDAIGGVIAVNGVDDAPGYARQREGGLVRLPARQRFGALVTDRAEPRRRGRLAARDRHRQLRRTGATRTATATFRAGCAAHGGLRRTSKSARCGHRSDRPNRVRRLRSGHLRARRHARQQPQPPRRGARVGRDRRTKPRHGAGGSAARCSARRTATSSPSEPLNRTQRHAAQRSMPSSSDASRPARSAPADRCCRSRTRDLPRPRRHSPAASTDQDRSREHQSLTAEWRATSAGSPATSRCGATCSTASRMRPRFAPRSWREIGGGFSLAGSYAEGIAQPTFFDLYGFFPE